MSDSWFGVNQDNPKARSKRMIHGERIKNFSPFMAAVRYEKHLGQMSICGATVVSDQHVLTAAHCLDKQMEPDDPESVHPSVRVCHGMLRRSEITNQEHKKAPVRCYQVKAVHIHPDFNRTAAEASGGRFDADIALVQLEKPFEGHNYCAMPLASNSTKAALDGQKQLWNWNGDDASQGNSEAWNCVALGWGSHARGFQSEHLKVVKLQNVENRDYDNGREPPQNGTVKCADSSMICAGHMQQAQTPHFSNKTVRRAPCRGDSGSPLIFIDNSTTPATASYVGLVSTGPTVCGYKAPTAFTGVTHYSDWVIKTIGDAYQATSRWCSNFRYLGVDHPVASSDLLNGNDDN